MGKFKILIVALVFFFGIQAICALAWSSPVSSPPTCNVGDPGCDPPLNISNVTQKKKGTLWINTVGNPTGLIVQSGNVGINTTAVSVGLNLDVEGKVGAMEYCDKDGLNCIAAADLGGASGDITAVNAGTGLLGGGSSGSVTLRGSGVLQKVDGGWKLKHYVLSLPVPNDIFKEVVEIINNTDVTPEE